jgi:diguanylate cyclase (GGDEF)-like protein
MDLSKHDLFTVINTVEYPIAVIDHEGAITFANHSFISLTGDVESTHLLFVSPKLQSDGKDSQKKLTDVISSLNNRDQMTITWTLKKSEINEFDVELVLSKAEINNELCFVVTSKPLSAGGNVSVLTNLPNRNAIQKHVENSKGQLSTRSMLFIDVNHFKPFNDKYGYSKGDDLIIFLSQLLKDIPSNFELEDYFVGHMEKDRFVVVLDKKYAKDSAELMCNFFDQAIGNFYNGIDTRQGSIQIVTRSGLVKDYPLMTLSVGGLELSDVPTLNYYQILDICEELVQKAKEDESSHVYFNKRNY